MKKIALTTLFLTVVFGFNSFAQKTKVKKFESFGNTLNLGVGVGYYGYAGRSMPVVNINYEFDVSKNFTLAPFISYYSYRSKYYWGDNNKNYPYKNYYYKETVIPIGVKGTYYLDDLVKASSKWDFYVAGSLGFAIVKTSWDNDYYGDRNYYKHADPLYLDLHLGAEVHLNKNVGLFLDLSTGVSTFGLAIH